MWENDTRNWESETSNWENVIFFTIVFAASLILLKVFQPSVELVKTAPISLILNKNS